jgi:hypothetical protein
LKAVVGVRESVDNRFALVQEAIVDKSDIKQIRKTISEESGSAVQDRLKVTVQREIVNVIRDEVTRTVQRQVSEVVRREVSVRINQSSSDPILIDKNQSRRLDIK